MREHGVPAVHRRRAPPGRRVRRARRVASPPSSATPTCCTALDLAGIPLHARGPHRRAPDRHRRRARGVQPRADRRLHRRRGARRRRAGRARRSPTVIRALEGRGPPRRPRRAAAAAGRAPAASTSRAFYDVDYLPDGRIQRVAPNRPGVPWRVAQAHGDGPRRVALPEAAAGAAGRDGARADVASRSSAAAPAAAGSARPA